MEDLTDSQLNRFIAENMLGLRKHYKGELLDDNILYDDKSDNFVYCAYWDFSKKADLMLYLKRKIVEMGFVCNSRNWFRYQVEIWQPSMGWLGKRLVKINADTEPRAVALAFVKLGVRCNEKLCEMVKKLKEKWV